MAASVVAARKISRQTSVSAPAIAAWAQISSVRQSAVRLWVSMMPPASLKSLPLWPIRSTCLNPCTAASSKAAPMKLEHFTTGTPSSCQPWASRKSSP